jgi:aspartyl-tRNA(Asn)/glutamyl-tRNA(Gln) amidotransferase subunit C
MPSSLTPKQVEQIAHLARLELTEAELAVLAPQLGAIVDYMTQLQQAPTDGVEPLAHALPVQNVFRDDEPAASLPVDEALANAPARRGNFYAVPAVLEEPECLPPTAPAGSPTS